MYHLQNFYPKKQLATSSKTLFLTNSGVSPCLWDRPPSFSLAFWLDPGRKRCSGCRVRIKNTRAVMKDKTDTSSIHRIAPYSRGEGLPHASEYWPNPCEMYSCWRVAALYFWSWLLRIPSFSPLNGWHMLCYKMQQKQAYQRTESSNSFITNNPPAHTDLASTFLWLRQTFTSATPSDSVKCSMRLPSSSQHKHSFLGSRLSAPAPSPYHHHLLQTHRLLSLQPSFSNVVNATDVNIYRSLSKIFSWKNEDKILKRRKRIPELLDKDLKRFHKDLEKIKSKDAIYLFWSNFIWFDNLIRVKKKGWTRIYLIFLTFQFSLLKKIFSYPIRKERKKN